MHAFLSPAAGEGVTRALMLALFPDTPRKAMHIAAMMGHILAPAWELTHPLLGLTGGWRRYLMTKTSHCVNDGAGPPLAASPTHCVRRAWNDPCGAGMASARRARYWAAPKRNGPWGTLQRDFLSGVPNSPLGRRLETAAGDAFTSTSSQ